MQINKTCCTDVNSSKKIELDTQEIYEQTKWLHGISNPTAHCGAGLKVSALVLLGSCLSCAL